MQKIVDSKKEKILPIVKSFTALRSFKLNFGPQHPAAHGVLRLILELNGEIVLSADPHIGFLHRGTEKLIENKTYLQALPYFDRLDYVSMMAQEHAYVLAVEKSMHISVPVRARYIRVIMSEITRILNHLMAITTHAMDVGALTPFLWGFEEREKLMELYEKLSGARMHAAYFRVGGVSQDIPQKTLQDISVFTNQFKYRICEINELLNQNRIWRQRLVGVGGLSRGDAIDMGFSGVLLRSTGVCHDIRFNSPYEIYNSITFQVPVGRFGDCFDRFLLRIEEMYQSVMIVEQAVNNIPLGLIKNDSFKISPPPRSLLKKDMESLISHFKYFSSGILVPKGEVYTCVESPKGEFGVHIVNNGTNSPYSIKVRSPGYYHLQGFNFMSYNHFLADTTTIIGTQDVVFGEIDR